MKERSLLLSGGECSSADHSTMIRMYLGRQLRLRACYSESIRKSIFKYSGGANNQDGRSRSWDTDSAEALDICSRNTGSGGFAMDQDVPIASGHGKGRRRWLGAEASS